MKNSESAGIIVIRYFNDEPKILCLMDDGSFDLPKGKVDPGETIIDAAIRETEEESGITLLNFKWGLKNIQVGNITMFIATTDEDPEIIANPETGEFEHEFA